MSDPVELEVVEREPVELTTTAIIQAPVVGGVPADQIQQWDAETLDVAKAHAQGLVEDIVFPEPTELAWDAVADKPAEFPPSAHRHEWDELDDIPATFAPSAHTHPWGQVTDVPEVFPPALHFHTWASIEDKPLVFPPSSHTHLWEQIANVPASFPPSAHSHAWGDVTGKPTTFTPAAHTHTVSQIADMPATPTWGTLGGKPTTFPPSAHQHAASDITSGVFAPARLGIGTASASTVLYGDGAWKDAPTGGSSGLTGPGRPDVPAGTGLATEIAAAPVGTVYTSTDGAGVGAWAWRKRATGWVVTDGDTGRRRITPTRTTMSVGFFTFSRRAEGCFVEIGGGPYDTFTLATLSNRTTVLAAGEVPLGWRPSGTAMIPLWTDGGGPPPGYVMVTGPSDSNFAQARGTASAAAQIFKGAGIGYPTNDAWPTTLPGVPG